MSFPPPSHPPSSKKKTGLIIGIIVVALACLCLVVIAIIGAVVFLNPGLQLQLQGTQFTSPDSGFSIYYPKGWVYGESNQTVTFATSHDVIDVGVAEGAVLYVMYVNRQENTFQLGDNVDPNSPEDLLDIFIKQQNGGILFLQPVSTLKVSGYPAASAVISVSDTTNNITYTAQLVVAVTPNTYYFLLGACPEKLWNIHASTFKGMLGTMKILNP